LGDADISRELKPRRGSAAGNDAKGEFLKQPQKIAPAAGIRIRAAIYRGLNYANVDRKAAAA
jgi:hypothetical protein